MKENILPRQCIVAGFVHPTKAEMTFRALDHLSQQVHKSLLTEPGQVRSALRRVIPASDRSMGLARRGMFLGAFVGLLVGLLVAGVFGVADGRDTIPQVLLSVGLTAVGLLAGGIVGAMAGWERPVDHIGRYERAVQEGLVLMVAAAEPTVLASAYEVIQHASPQLLDRHATTADDLEGGPTPVP